MKSVCVYKYWKKYEVVRILITESRHVFRLEFFYFVYFKFYHNLYYFMFIKKTIGNIHNTNKKRKKVHNFIFLYFLKFNILLSGLFGHCFCFLIYFMKYHFILRIYQENSNYEAGSYG